MDINKNQILTFEKSRGNTRYAGNIVFSDYFDAYLEVSSNGTTEDRARFREFLRTVDLSREINEDGTFSKHFTGEANKHGFSTEDINDQIALYQRKGGSGGVVATVRLSAFHDLFCKNLGEIFLKSKLFVNRSLENKPITSLNMPEIVALAEAGEADLISTFFGGVVSSEREKAILVDLILEEVIEDECTDAVDVMHLIRERKTAVEREIIWRKAYGIKVV